MAQSQPGGPPELYPCPRAFSVCLPGDPECVRTYRVVYNCCGGVCRVLQIYGASMGSMGYAEVIYHAESIQMPILPRVFCLISSQPFLSSSLQNSSIRLLIVIACSPLKPRALPCCPSGENRDCRIGEYS